MESQDRRCSASRFKRVCVFCGSSPGKKQTYQLAATELGHELVSSPLLSLISFRTNFNRLLFKGSGPLAIIMQVKRDIDLVYGGGSIGLMGLVSQAVYDGGRHVIGFVLLLFPSLSLSSNSFPQNKGEKRTHF